MKLFSIDSREKEVFAWLIGILVIFICLIFYYLHHANSASESIITVEPEANNNELNFTGTIAPGDVYPVTSLVDGVVDKRYFSYGQQVKANQILFHISSPKVLDDYRSAKVNYLKALQADQDMQNWQNSSDVISARRTLDTAKNELQNSQRQLMESTQLKKLGYISSDEYYSAQNQYQSSLSSFEQAQDSLNETLKKGQGINVQIEKLTLAQAQSSLQELQAQLNSLDVKAPHSGIALFPDKSSDNNSSSGTTEINVGSVVKPGDNLVTIGNLESITVAVKVNEVSVDQIKPGQDIVITGVAFPDITLNGKVESVDAQASSDANELPTFAVHMLVPGLTSEQRAPIKVGMSATVELNLGGPQVIMVPINAVSPGPNGTTVVKLVGKFGKTTEVPVVTGEISSDSVEIKQGLKPGDRIKVENE